MLIKGKSSLIIAISSGVIACALTLTVFGFYAYLEWKEKNTKRNYRVSVYDMDARLFAKYITLELEPKLDMQGTPSEKPIIEGTIKNTSRRKIYSLKIKIAFVDPAGEVLYVDTLCPVGVDPESLVPLSDITRKTRNFLLEGDSVSFTHSLKNCSPKVLDYLKSQLKFAKAKTDPPLEFVYRIEGVDIR
ncbi:MAG: hypothetical protein NG740_06250 [Omnitrophica bacterium]|nr:hypothetical protein [Candidatus Omnitrophota bacterium]